MSRWITRQAVTIMSVPTPRRDTLTRWLVTGTLIVVGLLGSLADRALVATPAWNDIGVSGWATYSLHADHGNGLILYPIQGILPTLLAISAAISHRLHRRGRHPASTPIYLTALWAVIALLRPAGGPDADT